MLLLEENGAYVFGDETTRVFADREEAMAVEEEQEEKEEEVLPASSGWVEPGCTEFGVALARRVTAKEMG